MGQGREKRRGGVHVVLVNWDGAVQALRGAWPNHHPIREPNQYLGAAPIHVDDASRANDTCTTR